MSLPALTAVTVMKCVTLLLFQEEKKIGLKDTEEKLCLSFTPLRTTLVAKLVARRLGLRYSGSPRLGWHTLGIRPGSVRSSTLLKDRRLSRE